MEAAEMERYGPQTAGSLQQFLPHHIKIMKVALALAIIRQKPRGVSSREFTERLALQFSQHQINWRGKAEQLQQELLRTRQELVRLHAQTETLSQPGVQWSDSEWQSSGYASSAQALSQAADLRTQHPGDILVAGSVPSASSQDGNDRITAHVKFLVSVSSVLSTQHQLSALTESDLRITVRDTLLQASKGLVEVLCPSTLPVLPPLLDSLEAALQVIVDVTRLPIMRPFWSEMEEACGALLKVIVRRMAKSVHKGLETEQAVLFSLILTLGSIPGLFKLAIEQLVSAVTECAEMLTNSLKDIGLLDTKMVENVAVIIKTLETLFRKYDITVLSEEVRLNLTKNLECSVLELSCAFPLFTYSVWTVVAHLAPTQH